MWHPICHQTAGNGCEDRYLWATLLTPHPEVRRGFVTLDRRNEGSMLGWNVTNTPTLKDLNKYQQDIQSLIHPNCSCNGSYRDLSEAFYPFDVNCLSLLTLEPIPNNLDDLLNPKPLSKDYFDLLSWYQDWKLILLGTNCD